MTIDYTQIISAQMVAAGERDALFSRLRDLRDLAIAAGITVSGFAIATDETSQGRILGAAVQAVIDPSVVINWKTGPSQFVSLTASMVIAIAQAVRVHVQACFDHEASLITAILAGTSPDITAGWPASAP